MSSTLERRWRALVNSNGFRRFAKWGIGAAVFRSQTYRRLTLARRYVSSYYKSRRDPAYLRSVEAFCLILGHTKSGGTLIGSLLDAHPGIMMADEADALQYMQSGFSREQLYHILVEGSRRAALKGRVTARRLEPYSLAVPGQWQGRCRTLKVVGDSTAGAATRRLASSPDSLHRLRDWTRDAVRMIHVIRNPYDPISIMMLRGGRTFNNAVQHYFAQCRMLAEIRRQAEDCILPVRYEAFIGQPDLHLQNICRFLGVEAEPEYLAACASILKPVPDRSRYLVEWSDRDIETVRIHMQHVDFLEGYSFGD
jgi:hypothetical protein